ncbi:MAG: hypothetical protein JWR74_353 [Polaromonas sp.]|nr:hypothetical protein [Polaromonas sp.]
MPSEIPHLKERLAEAARYALMRRLLPAIRHNIAGSLQPIGMMSAMLERRIQSLTPDLVQVAKNTQALTALSREAAATAKNLMTWLAPVDNELIPVNSAVDESFSLMATELSFRGFTLDNQAVDSLARLPKGMLRSVFTASLIALTDMADQPSAVVVTAHDEANGIRLKITVEPSGSDDLATLAIRIPTYRALLWDDVQALADVEGVQLEMAADGVLLDYCPAKAEKPTFLTVR